ncbi:carbohydrate kinase family protein [Patescibacteria group bacterium]
MNQFDVIGIGGATVDHLNIVEKFPEKDQKVIPIKSSIQGGGQAANAIACLARLGAKTGMIGTVGKGPVGQFAIDSLKEEGVETGCMVVQEGRAPALSSIIIEKDKGSRTIIADRGDLEEFVICDENYELIKNAKIVHSDAHFPEANLELVKFAKDQGVKICIDSEPHTPHSEEFVKYADYLIVSRSFVEAKFGQDYEKALNDFIEMGAEIAIVTLGKYGACGLQKGDKQCTSIPEYDVGPVVDTTGAGDVFHGAFLYGILQEWDFKKNMMFANVCAGMKCKFLGGRLGMPKFGDALKNLEDWKL